jgi:polysaccharide biosynthesis protein PslH
MAGNGRPRVLWVTEEPPDRALGGGNIRQAYLFEALAGAMPIDLLTSTPVTNVLLHDLAATVVELPTRRMPESRHPVGRRALELRVVLASRYPSALYSARANRRELARAVRVRADRYDVVCIEHETLAPLLPRHRSGRWIASLHNVLSGMIGSDLGLAPGARQRWFRSRDLAKAERLERWIVSEYDLCTVCSDEDAARLRSLCSSGVPSGRTAVIPNGVDLEALRPTPIPQAPRVLLPATLAWPPNIDGAIWLCKAIWPRVRATVPEAELVLAGRSPTAAVLALGDLPGVCVEADVPSMAPYFESARVIVVPLRVGTGTRLKALEAMAAGRPLVGTEIGLEGLGIVDRVHARVADDPDAFADAVIELLRSDAEATALAGAARAHVEGSFSWDRIGSQFVERVSALLDGSPAPESSLRSSSRRA